MIKFANKQQTTTEKIFGRGNMPLNVEEDSPLLCISGIRIMDGEGKTLNEKWFVAENEWSPVPFSYNGPGLGEYSRCLAKVVKRSGEKSLEIEFTDHLELDVVHTKLKVGDRKWYIQLIFFTSPTHHGCVLNFRSTTGKSDKPVTSHTFPTKTVSGVSHRLCSALW